ncbi:MAG TPA: transcriptional regulator NrdR [Dehalococcoidia bacterium]|jgi:transcriptional repressor NrdR|nr:transcriptional regulator NrdR [Dehalococcoidia bacterium]
MNCPSCGENATRIVESRASEAGIHRRRQCRACDDRFNTYEHVQSAAITVIKRDGRREEFQREKLRGSIKVCARKRPLPEGAVDAVVEDIERRLGSSDRSEVPSRVIGEMTINHLRDLDPIAYIRFASGYRQFVSVDDMLDDLAKLAYAALPAADQPRLFDDDFARLMSGAAIAPPSEGEVPVDDDLSPVPTPIGSARSVTHV